MATPKLLDQVRERIRVKHYSLRTEDAYLHWIRRLIFFHGKRHPREMGGPEVASLLYSTGTRLLEGLRLRVKDVDFERREITVRDVNKGGRGVTSPLDRLEPLSPPRQ